MSIVPDFIEKLVTIFQKTNCLHWTPDGSEFEITDIHDFSSHVLQEYFRHARLDSFVRQLNMYGFHKVNRRKNAYIFQHPHFTRDHPQNYSLIERVKKSKARVKKEASEGANLGIIPERLRVGAPNLAELLTQLMDFNANNEFDHRRLKNNLDALAKELSSKKLRLLRPILSSIKERLSYLEEIRKRVDQVKFQELLKEQELTPTKHNSIADSGSPLDFRIPPKCVSAPVMRWMQKGERERESLPICSEVEFQSVKSISNFLTIN